MKALTVLAVLIVALSLPIAVFAVNLPMTKVSVTPSSLAEAIAKNDQGVLNQSAFEYVATVQKMHPEVGVANVRDLVEYLQNLELRDLPQGVKFVFARVEKVRGWYEIKTFERIARPKEKGLYDRNLDKFIASADCGNVMKATIEEVSSISEEPASVVVVIYPAAVPQTAPAAPAMPPAPTVVVAPQQQLQAMPMFSAPPAVNFGRAYEGCPSGSECGQTAWFSGKLIEAGGFIGGMAVLRPPVTNYDHSFNSAGGNANASASSSSSSSATGGNATGGQGGQGGNGGAGGQGGTGGTGGQGGGPANPDPPAGGSPANPNPPTP